MLLVSAKKLNVTLNNHHILRDVSFSVDEGQIVAIIGPNGSGKTTLLRALLGLAPYAGEISLLGQPPENIRVLAGKVGFVPQRLEFDRSLPVTVSELLAIHGPGLGQEARTRILRVTGAAELAPRQVSALSGGEFQRVVFAVSLLSDPVLLILDEPTASVDTEGAGELYAILERLRKERNITALVVSHDIEMVMRVATQVLCLNHHLVCAGPPREAITPETLSQLYGKGFALHPHTDHAK